MAEAEVTETEGIDCRLSELVIGLMDVIELSPFPIDIGSVDPYCKKERKINIDRCIV
jgi:hypothetical protein